MESSSPLRSRTGSAFESPFASGQLPGSLPLTQGLLKAGLGDEMRLMVLPVILGSGRRRFPDDAEDKVRVSLVDTTSYLNGVQFHIFRPQG